MKKDKEKELFDLVNSIGELLEGDLHIIDHTSFGSFEEEKQYRVYHKDGYCLDVFKQVSEIDEETDKVTKWYYDFSCEWEGFDRLTAEKAIELIKPYAK